MSSESTTDARDGTTRQSMPVEAIERQLTAALEGAEEQEARYHLRQALQLVRGFDDLG